MELLVNDLSIDGQFPDVTAFRSAIGRIMKMRVVAQQFGRDLYCHRNIASARVTSQLTLHQAVQLWGRDEQRALMAWLTRHGPFWEDVRTHGGDEYLHWCGEIVTDTAVGEAAYRNMWGGRCDLISLTPSQWKFSPIPVEWVVDAGEDRAIDVLNHWELAGLEEALRNSAEPITAWKQLEDVALARFPHLTFSDDTFAPLVGHPFVVGAAGRILTLLEVLHRLRLCVDGQGRRTAEGQRLYQVHFTGDKAWFSPSSATECRDFQSELTFRNPLPGGEPLFCPWHGKVKSPQLRIHFSWPVPAGQPLIVVYVGPKITKR